MITARSLAPVLTAGVLAGLLACTTNESSYSDEAASGSGGSSSTVGSGGASSGSGGTLPGSGGAAGMAGNGTAAGGQASNAGSGGTGGTGGGEGAERNPCMWPFADYSIWNTPIGSDASYVFAEIKEPTQAGMTVDPDLIVMTPNAPLTGIYYNSAGWSDKDRCPVEGDLLFEAPMPADWVVPNGLPGTPNNGLAILMPDGRTIKQTQPFARCTAGGAATSKYTFKDEDLFTDGTRGAHGGSGMSALGGTLRLGELRPGKQPPRHVLKGNLYGKMNLFRCTTQSQCYRWPAVAADSYAVGEYGTGRSGIPTSMKMGVLLAIRPATTATSLGLETEPAKQLFWTLQNFGLYIVDDTAWDVYALETEQGPAGDFTEQFRSDWGFDFEQSSRDTPWTRDMRRLFTNLYVIDNNSATSVGGGGTPRVSGIPPLASSCAAGVGASD
jgi:hypothetical protein